MPWLTPARNTEPWIVVAPGLRHDAERRSRHLGFAEAGRHGERDLLRVGDVGVVAGHAAAVARGADAEAVDLQSPLVAVAPAGRAEDHHAGRRLDVGRRVALRLDRRHEQHHAAVAARGGNRGEHVARDRRLAPHALHVHDRRLAGYRDGFLDRAHAQLGVDRRRRHTGQLDALAFDRREPGQREADNVTARPQIDDPIPAGAVGHGGADLLDQHVACGLDRDAGQHGARGVAHHAGDRRLGEYLGGDEQQTATQGGAEEAPEQPVDSGHRSSPRDGLDLRRDRPAQTATVGRISECELTGEGYTPEAIAGKGVSWTKQVRCVLGRAGASRR